MYLPNLPKPAPKAKKQRNTFKTLACPTCLRKFMFFTTFERIEKRYPLIRKKDGSTEQYSSQKIRLGLENAFRKRKLSPAQLHNIFVQIDTSIAAQTSLEITSEDIGTLILEIIQPIDMVAYLRFASVYCEVNTIDEFISLLPKNSQQTLEEG